jgi:deoxyribose-phosphate aldolase
MGDATPGERRLALTAVRGSIRVKMSGGVH